LKCVFKTPASTKIRNARSGAGTKEDDTLEAKISVTINGFKETVPDGATLAFLIEHFGEKDPDLIVEHNGRFVFPHEYSTTVISENDRVEFINPDMGG
jgi:thiamine biosynthesis protein ThiS